MEPIIRTFLAQKIENIPIKAGLVCRLNRNPVFRYILGSGLYGKRPSEVMK